MHHNFVADLTFFITQPSFCFRPTLAHTYWFVDPEDVGAVREGLVRPKVSHGLGLDPRALLPFQHAGACCAIQRVDLTERRTTQ